MAGNKRIRQEQERKRRLILDAAKTLFMRDGFENVSMRRIAAAAEYSPAAIYRYFRSKREILSHLRNEGFTDFHGRQKKLDTSLPPEELLYRASRNYIRFALEKPADFYLMFCTTCEEVDLEGELAEESLRSYRHFREVIAHVVSTGYFGDVDEDAVAFGLWSGVQGLASLVISGRVEVFCECDIDELVDRVLRFLRRPGGESCANTSMTGNRL